MKYTYLALGDSYTIGEQVSIEESFPYQTVELLQQTAVRADSRRQGFAEPEIIAITGWTTDELDAVITAANISKQYDIVSLLIGVNNQYRGRSVSNFEIEFENLLKRAIHFAGNKPHHVFVLSIPDWGVTPFAEGRDRQLIATEIDSYNEVCKNLALQFNCNYIEITESQRVDGNKTEYLAEDGLHPSGKEYGKWAEKLAKTILIMDNE